MSASFPCAATFFFTYELSKALLSRQDTLALTFQHMIAAGVSEATQALVRNPFEVVKQNMQIGKYKAMNEAFVSLYQQRGISSFYVGYFSLISSPYLSAMRATSR